MTRIRWNFMGWMLGLWIGTGVGQGESADFDFARMPAGTGVAGWMPTHDVGALKTGDRGLTLPITGADPFITSPVLALGTVDAALVEMRVWSAAGGFGQLFWYQDGASEEASTWFTLRTNAWSDVCLVIPARGDGWRLRYDPPGTTGEHEVAWIRVRDWTPSAGIRVEAQRDTLTIRGKVPADGALVELRPHQELSEAATAPVVHRWTNRTQGEWVLPRRVLRDGMEVDRLAHGFVVMESNGADGLRPRGPIRWVEEFSGVARLSTPPVVAQGKKGLQVQMVDDALELGIHHAALNVNLPALMQPGDGGEAYEWRMDGRTYRFHRPTVDAIPVKELSDRGVVVSLILLAYASGQAERDRIWLHPGYDRRAPNRLGAFNLKSEEGAGWYRAALEFLAHRFSQPDARHGRASHFIVGNEVTAHWHWANMGEVPREVFIRDYERMVRVAHAAVGGVTDAIRVYLSFDHHWNVVYGDAPLRSIAGRRLLDGFAREASLGGNYGWHLAYHPYPENLFNPRTWDDQTATRSPETLRITFRNLEVLMDYLNRPELVWKGGARRVLLSEQGFHSDGTVAGEALQAAGYAYAWKKVAALQGVDAFILHRHVDHGQEGGLNLGLWRRKAGSISQPDSKKPSWEVFQAAGTDLEEARFRFALPLIGIGDWSEIK